jgi:hypothetical protein
LGSREEAFDYVSAKAQELEAQGYEKERAKDMGDLNYSLSLLAEDNEYIMLFAEDDLAATVSVKGKQVIFGEMYAYSRWVLHHIDNDAPTPPNADSFSQERF